MVARVRRSGWRSWPDRQVWLQAVFQLLFPGAIAEGGDVLCADSGNGLEQELGEIAEGDVPLLGDTALSHLRQGKEAEQRQ